MLERLKDFFYDVSDIILSIVIIVIMVVAISWKLSDTISYSPIKINMQETVSSAIVPESDDSHSAESSEPGESSDAETILEEESSIAEEATSPENGEVEEVPATNETPAENTETVVPKPSNENINVVAAKEINFIIPAGSSGASIASKLKTEGLIEDTSIFLNRLEALNLGNKLRSGTFKLSTDMDMDAIINKLTGR